MSTPHRIAFIGEAPGKDEESQGKPFVGLSGRFLNSLLSKASIVREQCYVGNVCQYYPGDKRPLATFDWDGPEIQAGLTQLCLDMRAFKPNLIVPLGNAALHALKGDVLKPLKRRKAKGELKFVFPNSIDSWRGSKFLATENISIAPGVKCLASYHPAYCLRQYENTPLLMMDLKRCKKESETPKFWIPERNLLVKDISVETILSTIDFIREQHRPIALDIEGYWTSMTCISISMTPADAFIIPFVRLDGTSYWSEEDETTITQALSVLLADPNVPKCWQNGLYDRFVLQYGFSMPVFGNRDDTMLKFWEMWCELPKNLGTQASVLTEEPYYKDERKDTDTTVHYTYCCRDSAVTQEINQKLDTLLPPVSRAHYEFNHSLLNLFMYCELRGILYAKEAAKERAVEIEQHICGLQYELDGYANTGIKSALLASDDASPEGLENLFRGIMCYKRDRNLVRSEYKDVAQRVFDIIKKPNITTQDLGYLSIILGLSMNIKSPKFKHFLYVILKLSPQYNDEGGETTDFNALLKLSKRYTHPALDIAIQIGCLRTRSQMLAIACDPDGRIRCGYNAVGTVTGRITCYTSPTGSGYNLQTIPDTDESKPITHPLHRGMRDLIIADPGHNFFNCDLKGSDGWTIGAHLKRLGDPTMLNDLYAGIKPAQRICYLLRHGLQSLKNKTLPEIKELLREVKKTDWDYFACKVGIWGICYLMGPDLLGDQIFEESDGKKIMSRAEIADFRNAVFFGYGIKLWHDWMARQLAKSPTLTSASGNTRRFFGRPTEILGEALSSEPQNNTTYATNLAAMRLWNDPDNRVDDKIILDSKGNIKRIPFRAEPLHQVHDSLNLQALYEDTEWTVDKLKSWFNNPIKIADQWITIPFSGSYGRSWGEQTTEF